MRASLLSALECPATGSRLQLEPIVSEGDHVEFGLLHGAGTSYPVLGGIPVFTATDRPLVDLVHQRRLREAVALAAFGDLEWSRARSALRALGDSFGKTRRVVRLADRILKDREVRRAVPLLEGADGRGPDRAALREAYLQSRPPNEDGLNYFTYRLGTPRHLVGLSLLEGVRARDGAVLDLGCGLGHFTWVARQRAATMPAVGVDTDFLSLLYAHARVVPDAEFVCADARWLPFRSETFSLVLASDVLPYVTHKRTVVGEMERVATRDGTLVLTALRNRLADHVHGGEPLSPARWIELVDHLDHQLFSDPEVLQRYFQRKGPQPSTIERVAREQTMSLIASRGHVAFDAGRRDCWPHGRGTLAVNPLLARYGVVPGGGVEYVRRLPSVTYQRDHPLLDTYLPDRVSLTREVVDQALVGRPGPELDAALACVAVLGLPDGLIDDAWPGFALNAEP
jgi:ubiquinone/menaquinone biosynthesis C-methylase UbiE